MFSLLAGGVPGGRLNARGWLERPGERLKARPGAGDRFSEGLLTAPIIFCAGPVTIAGTLDGLRRGSS